MLSRAAQVTDPSPRRALGQGSVVCTAGVNPKAIQTAMGHASMTMTMDRYGHLMPGGREEAARQVDNYLARASN